MFCNIAVVLFLRFCICHFSPELTLHLRPMLSAGVAVPDPHIRNFTPEMAGTVSHHFHLLILEHMGHLIRKNILHAILFQRHTQEQPGDKEKLFASCLASIQLRSEADNCNNFNVNRAIH